MNNELMELKNQIEFEFSKLILKSGQGATKIAELFVDFDYKRKAIDLNYKAFEDNRYKHYDRIEYTLSKNTNLDHVEYIENETKLNKDALINIVSLLKKL